MCAASGSPDVGHGQKCADEADHPVIAVGHVMGNVEVDLSMQLPGREVGPDLPEEIIELVSTLDLEQGTEESGKV